MKLLAKTMVLLWAFGSLPAWAANTQVYDHYDENNNASRSTRLSVREEMTVQINSTCATAFDYVIHRFKKPVAPAAAAPRNVLPPKTLPNCTRRTAIEAISAHESFCIAEDTVDLPVWHEEQYGGYVVSLRRKKGIAEITAVNSDQKDSLEKRYQIEYRNSSGALANGTACSTVERDAITNTVAKMVKDKKAKLLNESNIMISVIDEVWSYELSGGFTVSDVVDRKFALTPGPEDDAGVANSVLVRDFGAEDEQDIGLAGFIHMTRASCLKWWCQNWSPLSVGLGIQESSDLTLFVGTSWRLGKKAHVTTGFSWASTSVLPAGERLGSAPTNENVLSNLGSRTDRGLFIAFSYAFLNPGEDLFKKPFAPPNEN